MQGESEFKISVITVTYNSEHTIRRTIESVLNQTYQDVEYLLIDGKSDDNTVEIAREYEDKFRKKGYTYCIFSESDNGMYDALNKGIALATGSIIGQINSDDWYEPMALQRVADTYQKKNFDVFWADLRVIKESGNMIKKAKQSLFASTRYWNHPTTFIRAEVYKKNPYALLSMYDDFELILRLRKKGYRMVVLNEVLANFSFGGMSTQKKWEDMLKRIRWRCQNYKQNGYGPIYYMDSVCVEVVKFLLA